MDDLREVIARAVGETYDGCADPVDTPNNWARATSAADAALAAIKQAGGVVVPAEPTREQLDAAEDEEYRMAIETVRTDERFKRIYRAMIEASNG